MLNHGNKNQFCLSYIVKTASDLFPDTGFNSSSIVFSFTCQIHHTDTTISFSLFYRSYTHQFISSDQILTKKIHQVFECLSADNCCQVVSLRRRNGYLYPFKQVRYHSFFHYLFYSLSLLYRF